MARSRHSQISLSDAEELFGLERGYSLEELKAAYRRLVIRYHPDRNEGSQDSNFFMRQINEAYELLLESAEESPMEVRAEAGNDSPHEEERKRAAEAAAREAQKRHEEEERRQRQRREAEEERRRAEAAAREAQKRREEEERHQRQRREAEEERKRAEAEVREAQKRREEEKNRYDVEREQRLRKKRYREACKASQEANTAEEHAAVAEAFKKLGDYKDCESFCAYHENIAEEKRREEQKTRLQRNRVNAFLRISTMAATVTTMGFTIMTYAAIFGLEMFSNLLFGLFICFFMSLYGAALLFVLRISDIGGACSGADSIKFPGGVQTFISGLLALLSGSLWFIVAVAALAIGCIGCVWTTSKRSGPVVKLAFAITTCILVIVSICWCIIAHV